MKYFFLFVVAILSPLISHALVATNQALTTVDPSGTAGFTTLDWDYVVSFNNSSAVAIDPYWLLTAAHVADDAGHSSVTVGGTVYNQVDEVYHSTSDLALVRLDAPLPDYYDIYTAGYSISRPEVALVGYGGVGTITPTSDYTVGSSGRGTKRWGTNKIDGLITINSAPFSSSGLVMEFDTTDSTNEAGAGFGDSGGGVFYNQGGTWKLAGIMTNTVTNHATFPDSILAVDVQQYEGWIVSVIPEPPSWMLAGLSLGLLVGIQVFRRSEKG